MYEKNMMKLIKYLVIIQADKGFDLILKLKLKNGFYLVCFANTVYIYILLFYIVLYCYVYIIWGVYIYYYVLYYTVICLYYMRSLREGCVLH